MKMTRAILFFSLFFFFTVSPAVFAEETAKDSSWKSKIIDTYKSISDRLPNLPSKPELASSGKKIWDTLPRWEDVPIASITELLNGLAASFPVDLLKAKKWDYRVRDVDSPEPEVQEKFLNELGEDGWECYFVVPQPNRQTRFFLKKKPKSVFKNSFLTEAVLKVIFDQFFPSE